MQLVLAKPALTSPTSASSQRAARSSLRRHMRRTVAAL
jgi:hypothetical protein